MQGPVRQAATLFLVAVALRALLSVLASLYTGTPWPNLALLYDGHIYLLISRSFPFPYQGIHELFPAFRDSSYFTGWFPVYPALVAAVDLLLRETRVAALLASWLASGLAVVLFHRLARRVSSRPFEAALIFCAFPPAWLLCGSLSFVEPVLLCFFTAAFELSLAGRLLPALLLGGLATVSQKSGFLVVPVLAGAALARDPRDWRTPAAYALCLVPLALFAAYLGLLFRDPLMLLRVQGEVYAGAAWAWPFETLARGLLSPTQMFRDDFWLRKALIASSALFYLSILVLSWRRRLDRSLLVWLGVILGVMICLGRPAYEPFPRYMLLAAPPAVLLATELLRPRLGLGLLGGWGAAALLGLVLGARDVSGAAELLLRVWPPGYFDSLVQHLRR